jgi:hypothetical protein
MQFKSQKAPYSRPFGPLYGAIVGLCLEKAPSRLAAHKPAALYAVGAASQLFVPPWFERMERVLHIHVLLN